MAQFQIDVESAEVQRVFNRLLRRLDNVEPALRDVGEYLLLSHRERFDREQSPDGSPWLPNAESTKRYKKNPKVLHESLTLRDTLTYQVQGETLLFGSNVVYAAIHQFGGRAGRGGAVVIPARPFLGLSDADETEIVNIFNDYLGESFG